VILVDAPSAEYLPYHYGVSHVAEVYKGGVRVFTRGAPGAT